MDKIMVYEKTMSKQANRIATLMLDLDLAHTQIDLLNEELKTVKEGEEEGE